MGGEGIIFYLKQNDMANNSELPLSEAQAKKAIKWLRDNFADKIENAVTGTPFTAEDIYAISCQETAYRWIAWIDKMKAEDVLKYCIFDATGDTSDTKGERKAFPTCKENMLVAEGNKMRAVMGWSAKDFLYKGYGIFQYDLQFVKNDKAFFEQKQWYSFDECLKRVMKELNGKYSITKDIYKSIRAYNGGGEAATNYANNVMQFKQWC
jgi:hypothetical protein